MTTTGAAPDARELEILMSFAAEGDPTPKRLDEFVKEHPDLRHELTELAVEMVLEPSRPLPAADASTREIVSSAWARFQAATARRPEGSGGAAYGSSPRDIFQAFSGAAFPQLAKRLGVTPVFLIKLRDGLIATAGFPRAFATLIADEVGHGVEAIQALLEGPASMPAGTMAKSDGKPEAGRKQTFEEAIASSGLTPEQQRRLLAMAEAERGSD